jgi:hypothetical protein
MGIKFRCPNGHKLNVKSHLAGRRGVCPDCGTTFRIPREGTSDSSILAQPIESRRSRRGTGSGEADEGDDAVSIAVATAADPADETAVPIRYLPPQGSEASDSRTLLAGPQAQDTPATTVDESPAPGITFLATPTALPAPGTTVPKPAVPQPPPAPPSPAARVDPIGEAPEAIWYVRPPTGGQFGPARGDVLRKWIGEGRVSGDSLVWREGWPDWRSAGDLFPELCPSQKAADVAPVAPAVAPRPARVPDRKAAKKKANSEMAVAALVCLVLVCLILVTVLVIVLAQQGA